MSKLGRRLKFPQPQDYKSSAPAIFCPAERVIELYNQDAGDSAQRIAKKVRAWFTTEAHKRGWAGVYFLPEVQSNHGAGCVLWRPTDNINVNIKITQDMLILRESLEDASDNG
jgi:hypothetical protein